MIDFSAQKPSDSCSKSDFAEHKKTYLRFLALIQYATLFCVALLVAMAFSFFGSFGWFSGFCLFLLILTAGSFFIQMFFS